MEALFINSNRDCFVRFTRLIRNSINFFFKFERNSITLGLRRTSKTYGSALGKGKGQALQEYPQ